MTFHSWSPFNSLPVFLRLCLLRFFLSCRCVLSFFCRSYPVCPPHPYLSFTTSIRGDQREGVKEDRYPPGSPRLLTFLILRDHPVSFPLYPHQSLLVGIERDHLAICRLAGLLGFLSNFLLPSPFHVIAHRKNEVAGGSPRGLAERSRCVHGFNALILHHLAFGCYSIGCVLQHPWLSDHIGCVLISTAEVELLCSPVPGLISYLFSSQPRRCP